VFLAIVRRMRRGRPVTRPDKEHIHHRLLEIGHSHRQAVLLMYLWSALLAGAALLITFVRSRTLALWLIVAVVAVLAGSALARPRRNGRRWARAKSPAEAPQEGAGGV
jgi:UDP-GlcNAc:undecaprenyl-phosphate GlcNAc-1-phosphate transferase